jgi:hypothetical protein
MTAELSQPTISCFFRIKLLNPCVSIARGASRSRWCGISAVSTTWTSALQCTKRNGRPRASRLVPSSAFPYTVYSFIPRPAYLQLIRAFFCILLHRFIHPHPLLVHFITASAVQHAPHLSYHLLLLCCLPSPASFFTLTLTPSHPHTLSHSLTLSHSQHSATPQLLGTT